MKTVKYKIKGIKRVYISGKISGLPIERVNLKFHCDCDEVLKHYEADFIVNPLDIKPFLGIKSWLCYMINDIRAQSKCTHTAFSYDWLDSKGAVIEYFFAKFIFKHQIIFLK